MATELAAVYKRTILWLQQPMQLTGHRLWLKIETLKAPSAKLGSSLAKSVPGATSAPALEPEPKSNRGPGARSVGGEDRRRSQRVLLRVRSNIHIALEGRPSTLSAMTLSVNDHGALVLLQKSLPVDARLILEHTATRGKVTGRVARTARRMPEGYHVPIEFDSPEPKFWGIVFPAADGLPPGDV
jgi:hypothetical protein